MVSTKLALLVAVTATAAPSAFAYPKYSPLIPNGEAMGKALGHTDAGYTPFGSLFSAKGKTWAGVCKEMWPGQTKLTVGAVLGDPCCKWTSGKPDFELSAPNTAGTTCASDAKTPPAAPAAPAAAPAAPAAAPAAPAGGAAQNTPVAPAPAPSTPQLPGKVQPAQPAPGAGGAGPVPAPVPAPVPVPGKAGNSTAPAPTPAASKLPGKPSGNAHKNCH